jgi:hypothetical protein
MEGIRLLSNRDITIPVCDADYNFVQGFIVGKQHEYIGLEM